MGIPTKVATDVAERLARARDTNGALEAQRRATLEELRQSIRELRELGSTMSTLGRVGSAAPSARGSAHDPANDVDVFALGERFGLSLRELEVALLVAQGLSNREIAAAVRVSAHTARHHTQHVLGKLGVRSRSRAAALINDLLGPGRVGRPNAPRA